MDLASASVDVQAQAFEQLVLRNPVVAVVVERIPLFGLPGCYLAAGALFQTVWNCLSGRHPGAGIKTTT